jgi:hypothetical protein
MEATSAADRRVVVQAEARLAVARDRFLEAERSGCGDMSDLRSAVYKARRRRDEYLRYGRPTGAAFTTRVA